METTISIFITSWNLINRKTIDFAVCYIIDYKKLQAGLSQLKTTSVLYSTEEHTRKYAEWEHG